MTTFSLTHKDKRSILSKNQYPLHTTTHNKYTTKSQLGPSFRDLFIFMLEKEFRNEDPSGKIIAFMLLIVSLIGGGAFALNSVCKAFHP